MKSERKSRWITLIRPQKSNLKPSPSIPESRLRRFLLTPFRVLGSDRSIGSALGPFSKIFPKMHSSDLWLSSF